MWYLENAFDLNFGNKKLDFESAHEQMFIAPISFLL